MMPPIFAVARNATTSWGVIGISSPMASPFASPRARKALAHVSTSAASSA